MVAYMTYDTNNIFAKILNGDMPCDKVFENEHVLAFYDIAPAAPVHVIIIPKGHYISYHDFTHSASSEEILGFYKAVKHIAEMLDVVDQGYRLITNHGVHASQTVPHFHMHLLAGKPLGGLLHNDTLLR